MGATLGPLADFTAHIDNEGKSPKLVKICEGISCRTNLAGSWEEVRNRLTHIPEPAKITAITSSFEEIVRRRPVVMFSKTYCSWCKKAALILRRHTAHAKIIELDSMDLNSTIGDPHTNTSTLTIISQMAIQRMTGASSVPQIFLGG